MAELIANPAARSTFRDYMAKALPRFLAYGLIVWFLMDLTEILFTYWSTDANNEAALVAQVIDRIAIPLLGYTLMFTFHPMDPHTLEKMFRKVISYFSLVMALGCLGFIGLLPLANLKVYRIAMLTSMESLRNKTQYYEGLGKNLPKLSDSQVTTIYDDMHRRLEQAPKVVTLGEQRVYILTNLNQTLEREKVATANNQLHLRKAIMVSSAKYMGESFIACLLFMIVWQASAMARNTSVFRRYRSYTDDRKITFVTLWWGTFLDFVKPPKLEDYRWYRRLRRFFGKWKY